MRVKTFILAIAVAAACSKPSKQAPSETNAVASGAMTPGPQDAPTTIDSSIQQNDAAQAQMDATPAGKMLEKQLGMLPTLHEDLAGTFRTDALVLTPEAVEATDASNELGTSIPRLYGQKTFEQFKIKTLTAGARPGMTWAGSVIDIAYTDADGKHTRTLRSLELLDAQQGKVAAASFGEIMKLSTRQQASSLVKKTDAGPLTNLLISPSAVAATLSDDPNVVVFGTDPAEEAVGPESAKKLLASWGHLKLSLDNNESYEIRTNSWGYAIANVSFPSKSGSPNRMSALIVGVPDGSGWKIVGLHYLPQ